MPTTFEFTGGHLDGRRASTDADDPHEAWWARAYAHLTENGAVGKRFQGVSDAALGHLSDNPQTTARFPYHTYEVIGRDETPERVIVRVRYIGANVE